MIYLAANNSKVWKLRANGYPLGWCMSPDGWRHPSRNGQEMPYILDNGLFHPFDQPPKPESCIDKFIEMLGKAVAGHHQPIFRCSAGRSVQRHCLAGAFAELVAQAAAAVPNDQMGCSGSGRNGRIGIGRIRCGVCGGEHGMEMENSSIVGDDGARSRHVGSRCTGEHAAKDRILPRYRGGLSGRDRHLSRGQDATTGRARSVDAAVVVPMNLLVEGGAA